MRERAVLMVQSDPVTRTKSPEHLAAFEWMTAYADRLVAMREENPGEDLMSQFILSEIDGERVITSYSIHYTKLYENDNNA